MDLANLINSDPERMSGEVCFQGTRVPVRNLFDYLAAGQPLSNSLPTFLLPWHSSRLPQIDSWTLRLSSPCWRRHSRNRGPAMCC